MMRSLYSGISGLKNHQTRMDVIGNNIANVNTAGYKTSRVIFQDIFSQNVASGMANQVNIGGTNPIQIGLGIRLSNVDVLHTRAAFGRTDRETDMMINGDGFFIVMQTNPQTGEDEKMYTRAGNFSIDSEGYLVTSHGYFVMGYTVPVEMGMISEGQYEDEIPARTELTVDLGGFNYGDTINLADLGLTAPGEPVLTGTIYLDPNGFQYTDIAGNTINVPAGAAGTLIGGGGAYEIIVRQETDAVEGYWVKQPVYGLIAKGSPEATGDTGLQKICVFSSAYQGINWGDLHPDDQAALVILNNNVVAARTALQEAQAELKNSPQDPILQAAAAAAEQAYIEAQTAITTHLEENLIIPVPFETVSLPGFAVANNGDVSVIVANRSLVIGRVALAMFANPEGLEKAGNSLYRETASSGPVVTTEAFSDGAGKIDGGGLEMSNVDMASEFTDMIVTQRGFQANSRIITVSDTMLEELVNLKR